ncbi:MAG: hypothetical protein M1404_00535 [Acidobacteria bacterium]|nr:hypothetical protein [Acidobacteriota bacterium]
MKQTGCGNEERVLEALGKGGAPEAFEEPLRQHVATCASCAELVAVYEMFQKDSEQLRAAAPVPEAGRVWWRAVLAARRAAAERALRPIMIAEKAALAVGGGVLIALLVFAAPWLAAQLARPSALAGSVLYFFPMPWLIATSVVACVLLVAGTVYTLRAGK